MMCDQVLRIGIFDHVAHLARSVGDVERNHHRAETGEREPGQRERRDVGQHDRDMGRFADTGPRHAVRESVHPPVEGAIGDGLAALEEVPGNPLGRLGCSLVKDRGNVRGQRLGLDPSPARVERRHLQAEHVASRHSLRPPLRALRNAKHAADVSEADPLLMVLLRQADEGRVFVWTASARICRRPNSSDIGRVAAKADAADAIGEPARQSSRRRPPRIPWQRSRAAGSAGRPAAVASRSPATAAA